MAAGSSERIVSTHSRIPDAEAGIAGGSYCIPESEQEDFLKIYFNEVVSHNKTEHLTEKQLGDGKSPLVIDLDLHFPLHVTKRVYTKEDIKNLIYEFLAMFRDVVFQLSDADSFPIFVMEKSKMNPVHEKDMTKDGIHIIFGVQMDHASQAVVREKMIPVLEELWGDFGITNSWSDVYDPAITSGKTNWQLYGSSKPKHEAYRLTHVFMVNVDTEDGEPMVTTGSPREFLADFEKFQQLSVRYPNHARLMYRDSFLQLVANKNNARRTIAVAGGPAAAAAAAAAAVPGNHGLGTGAAIAYVMTDFARIRTKENLETELQQFLQSLAPIEYHLQEMYEYAMILPASFYDERNKWIRVGWALKNVSESLLIVWLAFSAKSNKFSFSDIPKLCNDWRSFSAKDVGKLTDRSIIYWAVNENPEQAAMVSKNTVSHYIDITLNAVPVSGTTRKGPTKGGSDFDIANILLQMFKGIFVCVDIARNSWYRFENHRWREIDTGDELRLGMSRELRCMFEDRVRELHNYMSTLDPEDKEDNRFKKAQHRMETAFKIIDRLKCNADKKSILKECADLFKDRNFLQRLDNTPMLLGCLNGVVDFNTNTFRRGLPEDYISKSTQINYIPLSDPVHVDIRPEIDDFMEKIFPMEDLREYMWNHLSASLVGVPHKNQKMHFYLGKGSNGKSVLTELMKQTFGSETSSYFVEANIGLVTRPRGTPGQASPETIALKGTRYAVMNEPASNDCIYEGRMKELVSGVESITGRHLYKNEESFKPQYSMVMCCNEFPTIKGSDHGTWRRVVVVDFISQFSDNPQPTPENPYQYRADHELLSRLPVWRETFLAMLVERAFRNFGAFSPCKTVEEATKRFKQRDDFICNFVGERIQKQTGRRLTKIALNEEFDLWFKNNGDGKKPKLRQLHEMMDTKFGKVRNEGWMDCCVVEIDEEMNFPQGEEENTFVGQDFVEDEDD